MPQPGQLVQTMGDPVRETGVQLPSLFDQPEEQHRVAEMTDQPAAQVPHHVVEPALVRLPVRECHRRCQVVRRGSASQAEREVPVRARLGRNAEAGSGLRARNGPSPSGSSQSRPGAGFRSANRMAGRPFGSLRGPQHAADEVILTGGRVRARHGVLDDDPFLSAGRRPGRCRPRCAAFCAGRRDADVPDRGSG